MESPLELTFGARSALFLQSVDDFHSYRVRVNRRIAKLKKSLNLAVKDTRNYKTKEKTSQITAEQFNNDSRYGLVYLYLAERDFLHYLEANAILEVVSSKPKETFIISKLKKTLKYSNRLIALLIESKYKEDIFFSFEIYIYNSLINGIFAVKRKNWKLAVKFFSFARCTLQFLENYQLNNKKSINSKDTTGSINHLYKEIIDTIVDPNLKLSIFQISNVSSPDLNKTSKKSCSLILDDKSSSFNPVISKIYKIDQTFVMSSADEENENLTVDVTWRDYTAHIYNEEIPRLLNHINKNSSKINDSVSDSFDEVLINWQDCLEIHQQDLNRSNKNADDDINSEEYQNNQVLLTYLNYNLYFLRIRRDLSLVNEFNSKLFDNTNNNGSLLSGSQLKANLKIIKDITRVYCLILNTVKQLQELPGVYSDESLFYSLEALQSYFEGSKNYYIVLFYNSIHKYKESLVILNKSIQILNSLKAKDKLIEFPANILTKINFEDLLKKYNELVLKISIAVEFEAQNSVKAASANNLVIDNVTDFNLDWENPQNHLNHIATLENNVVPVSVKPVLFDIAFNYIT
ncbi:signal recognition particle subunit SRP68 ASCRUDRAFT_18306, partial [Ascoidea rubescens DSM 1968]